MQPAPTGQFFCGLSESDRWNRLTTSDPGEMVVWASLSPGRWAPGGTLRSNELDVVPSVLRSVAEKLSSVGPVAPRRFLLARDSVRVPHIRLSCLVLSPLAGYRAHVRPEDPRRTEPGCQCLTTTGTPRQP